MFEEFEAIARVNREFKARAWRAWSLDSAVASDYAAFCSALPKSEAIPDFSLARTLMQVVVCEKRKQENDFLEMLLASIGGAFEGPPCAKVALALDKNSFSWSPAEISLRERFFSATSPLDAAPLALAAMDLEGAPWRRWSCASPIAAELFAELDKLGHQEPAVLGKCASLPCLMGFSNRPVDSWIKTVALASSPASFVSGGSFVSERALCAFADSEDSIVSEYFERQDPHGLIGRTALNNSTSALACQAPLETVLWCSVGFFDFQKLEADQKKEQGSDHALFAARSASLPGIERAPFLLRCLSQKNSGLPIGFDHRWPLKAAADLPSGMEVDPVAVLIEMGASPNDIFERAPLWESAARPRCSPFDQEYYAPLDESRLLALLRGGADFSSMLIGAKGGKSSLMDCYREMLDPLAADAACSKVQEALAKHERDFLDVSTVAAGRVLGKPRRSI